MALWIVLAVKFGLVVFLANVAYSLVVVIFQRGALYSQCDC